MADGGREPIQFHHAEGSTTLAWPEPLHLSPTLGASPQLSIVAACCNEQACLPEFHRHATAAAREVVGDDDEVVLVNDGSKDATLAVMRALAAPIQIISGLQRLFLGLMGEYVGRIYMEAKRRPLFVVSDIHRFGNEF